MSATTGRATACAAQHAAENRGVEGVGSTDVVLPPGWRQCQASQASGGGGGRVARASCWGLVLLVAASGGAWTKKTQTEIEAFFHVRLPGLNLPAAAPAAQPQQHP